MIGIFQCDFFYTIDTLLCHTGFTGFQITGITGFRGIGNRLCLLLLRCGNTGYCNIDRLCNLGVTRRFYQIRLMQLNAAISQNTFHSRIAGINGLCFTIYRDSDIVFLLDCDFISIFCFNQGSNAVIFLTEGRVLQSSFRISLIHGYDLGGLSICDGIFIHTHRNNREGHGCCHNQSSQRNGTMF